MKNQVIEALDREHGKKVIDYWKSRGVNTLHMNGDCTRDGKYDIRYYGVINGKFSNYTLEEVKAYNAKIIELHIENSRPFPKPMQVSMFPFGNSAYNVQTRVVVAAGNGYAVGVNNCESLDDYIKLQKANMLSYTLWKYYQEIPNKIIISKAEIAEKFGVPFDYIKIVD